MIYYENHLGSVDLSDEYFEALVSQTVVSCFGVAAMSTKPVGGILSAFSHKNPYKGIVVNYRGGELTIDLHIIVLYGLNIKAVVESIIEKVTYQVQTVTSLQVQAVNVYIDGMTGEE